MSATWHVMLPGEEPLDTGLPVRGPTGEVVVDWTPDAARTCVWLVSIWDRPEAVWDTRENAYRAAVQYVLESCDDPDEVKARGATDEEIMA